MCFCEWAEEAPLFGAAPFYRSFATTKPSYLLIAHSLLELLLVDHDTTIAFAFASSSRMTLQNT